MGLFNLIFTLGINNGPFKAGLKASQNLAKDHAQNLKRHFAGIFTVAAVGAWINSVKDATGRIKDLSEQTGITTDEVQKADFALKQSGLAFEDLSGAMNKLAGARRDAVEGNAELRASFEKFGLSVRDLNDPQTRNFDLLMKISKAMADGSVKSDTQTQIMDLLGTKAGKLAFVLKDLATIEPPDLFKEEDIKRIDESTKALERFKFVAQTLTGEGIGRGFDLIDSLTGKHKERLQEADRPISLDELQAASRAKKERMALAAAANADLFKVGGGDEGPGIFDIMNQALGFVQSKIKPQRESSAIFKPAGDQLVSVGNFLGSDPSGAMRSELRKMDERLKAIEANTRKTANNALVISKV